MRGKQLDSMDDRLTTVEKLLDKVDRSVERIEIVTVVREPNSAVAADAYNGLRKQVIAAVGERNSHLHQLAQFDSALRAGATAEELDTLVREWLAQASVELVDDPAMKDAFEFVGADGGTEVKVVKPAYVDALTGRVIRQGIAERVVGNESGSPERAAGGEEAARAVEDSKPLGDDAEESSTTSGATQ